MIAKNQEEPDEESNFYELKELAEMKIEVLLSEMQDTEGFYRRLGYCSRRFSGK